MQRERDAASLDAAWSAPVQRAAEGGTTLERLTGIISDRAILHDAIIAPAVKSHFKDGKAILGHVRFHSDAEFKKLFISYYLKHDSTATLTQAEAEEPGCYGFADRDEGLLHIPTSRARIQVAFHEALHLVSSPAYRDEYYSHVDEGTTEYFARKLCQDWGIQTETVYAKDYRAAQVLVDFAGVSAVANAYFNGDTQGLWDACDHKRPGVYAQWIEALDGHGTDPFGFTP